MMAAPHLTSSTPGGSNLTIRMEPGRGVGDCAGAKSKVGVEGSECDYTGVTQSDMRLAGDCDEGSDNS